MSASYTQLEPELKAAAAPPSRTSCFTRKFCLCLSLATGVALLAALDALHALGAALAIAAVAYARTHEHAVELAVEKGLELRYFAARRVSFISPANNATAVAETVAPRVEHCVELAARGVPLLAFACAVLVVAAAVGFRAAKGDAKSARRYYYWRVATVVSALPSLDGGPFVLFAALYAAVVARSHHVALEEAASALPTTVNPNCDEEDGAAAAAAPPPATAQTPVAYVGVKA